MIRRHTDVDIYVDGQLVFLRALLTEDTSNHVLTVTVRDQAGPNVFTDVLRLYDFEDEGEQNRIRFFTGKAESVAPDNIGPVFRLSEPKMIALSAAPRKGGCGCNQ